MGGIQNLFYVSQYAENYFSTYPHNIGILQKDFCISRILLPFAEFADLLRFVLEIFLSLLGLGFYTYRGQIPTATEQEYSLE